MRYVVVVRGMNYCVKDSQTGEIVQNFITKSPAQKAADYFNWSAESPVKDEELSDTDDQNTHLRLHQEELEASGHGDIYKPHTLPKNWSDVMD
jgi:hypothetical protein